MPVEESIKAVAKELEVYSPEENESHFRQMVIDRIRELIHSDFQKLVNILYRMDVSETKLKLLLKDNPGSDAGIIITDLMIERQAEKIKSRNETRSNREIPDDEKW